MKLLVLLSAVVGLVASQSFYVIKDDNLDIDAVVADLAMLQSYVDCFLDNAPCTPLAQSLKDIMQEAIMRTCDRCDVNQKQRFGKFLIGLQKQLPELYKSFREKYDPTNIYFEALQAELSKFINP